ncbi:MAG: type II toxin-antitoxin system RelE family toxin [Sphingorhabdus sp.]|uniref:type II toxin-antitoxin system RelE family toxin n=1 Tax=Sphingorhabdus sp. TaxID=1902408 RepID=UPI0038FCDF22
MKIYSLEFIPESQKEWNKLNPDLRSQFAKKLQQILVNPIIPKARLRELPDCYKIKLRAIGYRLVYKVEEERVIVQVIAIGKRDRNEAYNKASNRL